MSSTIEESGQIQNKCPYCGSTESFYDEYALKPDAELPPKPWYGIDPYSDLESGVTYSRILHVDEWGIADPHSCPSCGRKLEGTVRMNSVEAGRAAAGNCPWCGSALPAGRRVRLGTK